MPPSYAFERLDSEQVVAFQPLTYPHYRPRLLEAARAGALVAIGVRQGTVPVGLALADHPRDSDVGVVLSLYVAPSHRSRGLGRTLFELLEDALRRRGCREATGTFIDGTPSTRGVEAILGRHGWSSPLERMWVCTGTRESIASLPWLRDLSLPESYQLFPWSELRDDERQALLNAEASSPRYPDFLSPFRDEHLIEPLTSLGLRHGTEVVGWLITHRIAPDTIRYTSLFVREDLQGLGRAIPMLARAILLQLDEGRASKGSFAVFAENRAMTRFIQRRMAPYLASVRKSWETGKSLSPLTSDAMLAGL